jgi:hypothetical protein
MQKRYFLRPIAILFGVELANPFLAKNQRLSTEDLLVIDSRQN